MTSPANFGSRSVRRIFLVASAVHSAGVARWASNASNVRVVPPNQTIVRGNLERDRAKRQTIRWRGFLSFLNVGSLGLTEWRRRLRVILLEQRLGVLVEDHEVISEFPECLPPF